MSDNAEAVINGDVWWPMFPKERRTMKVGQKRYAPEGDIWEITEVDQKGLRFRMKWVGKTQ